MYAYVDGASFICGQGIFVGNELVFFCLIW